MTNTEKENVDMDIKEEEGEIDINNESKTEDAAKDEKSDKQSCETSEDSLKGKDSEKKSAAEESEEDEDLKNKYMRLAADFQNFKKRADREKNDIYAYANQEIALDMLNVIDTFEIALSHKEGVEKNFIDGMEKILKQFKGVLEKNGIEEIKADGAEFDPVFHHAVMTEDTDRFQSGQVSAVLKKGYMLNGKVIRAAMVKVAQ